MATSGTASRHDHKRTARRMAWVGAVLLFSLMLGACLRMPGNENPTATQFPLVTPQVETAMPELLSTETPSTASTVDQSQALMDKIWVLVGYGEVNNPTVVEEGSVVTIEFGSDGIIDGSGGCNTYSASYNLEGNRLTVEPIVSTTMACEKGMEQENAYFQALQSAQSYIITTEARLEIVYDVGAGYETRLFFVRGQTPLVDTLWVLQSYGDPEQPTEVEKGVAITAVFTDKGTINGSSGCNQYSAVYAVGENGEDLSINTPVSTRKACITGMEQEAEYLGILPRAESFRIIGSRLEINYGSGSGLLTYTSTHLPLENTLWTLISLNGGPVAENAPLTMQFIPGERLDAGNVGGVVGCNNYNGQYTITDDGGLTIEDMATTFMACTPEVMEIEQSYINTLETAESYQIMSDSLIITSPLAILTFAADRTPLEGTYWTLVSIGEASSPIPPVEGSNFTAQFLRAPDVPSGSLQGTTGCKVYQSTYVASLAEMKINPVDVIESKECSSEIIDQEQAYFLGLSTASTYQIVGNMLTIDVGGDAVLNFIAAAPPIAPSPDLTVLDGTLWFLQTMNNMSVLPGTQITALFDINDDRVTGRVSGTGGCNTYNSGILAGFEIDTPVVTQKNCDQPVGIMDQERLYLEMLQKSRSYSMNAEQLIIVTAIGQLVYSNLPIEPPPDPSMLLFNRTWFLTSINNNAAIPGYEPRAYFSSDGSLNGFTGCNLYSARFITDMSSIAIAPIAKTEDPCNDPILTQERAFINALQVVTEFKVDATTMQLIGINGVLNFTITPPKSPVPSPIHPATETPVLTPTTSATQTADPQATSAAG